MIFVKRFFKSFVPYSEMAGVASRGKDCKQQFMHASEDAVAPSLLPRSVSHTQANGSHSAHANANKAVARGDPSVLASLIVGVPTP